jgi:hypothetical protein
MGIFSDIEGLISKNVTNPLQKSTFMNKKIPFTKSLIDKEKTDTSYFNDSGLSVRTYWCPNIYGLLSQQMNPEDGNWITIDAIYFEKLLFDGRADLGESSIGRPQFRFNFRVPRDMIENLSHEWAPFETMASKASESAAKIAGIDAELRGLGASFGFDGVAKTTAEYLEKFETWAKGQPKAGDLIAAARKILNSVTHMQGYMVNSRVDAPLAYKSSQRRQFEFMFYLVAIRDRDLEIIEPVRLLQYLSSPSKGLADDKVDDRGNTAIKLPFLFRIRVSKMLYIDLAALTVVQPTFKGPWVDGYPSYCELRLSFMEYKPLFDEVFDNTKKFGKVTTREIISDKNGYGLGSGSAD